MIVQQTNINSKKTFFFPVQSYLIMDSPRELGFFYDSATDGVDAVVKGLGLQYFHFLNKIHFCIDYKTYNYMGKSLSWQLNIKYLLFAILYKFPS